LIFDVGGGVVLHIYQKWMKEMNNSNEEDKGNELSFQPMSK